MKFVSLLFLTLFSLSAMAQGEVIIRREEPQAPETSAAQSAPAQDEVPPTDQAANGNEAPVEYVPSPDDADEQALDELTNAREERAETIEQITAIAPKEVFDPVAELQKLGYKEISAEALMDAKVIPIFTRILKESNLKGQDPQEIKNMIGTQFKGQPIGRFFENCPKCLTIFVDILQDEKAMPGLLRIFTLKEHLKKYFYVWLFMFILVWWLKRKLIPKKAPFLSRMARSMLISACFMFLTFFVFYQMFYKETQPTVAIILRHL